MDRWFLNILSRNSRGQLLIEAMVAISVLMIGMMAVFGVLSQSMSLNRVAADQYVAANLASEGVEIIKNLVDSEYDPEYPTNFLAPVANLLGRTCVVDINFTSPAVCESPSDPLQFDKDGIYNLTGGSPTKFIRYVELSYNNDSGDEYIEVHSTVEWGRRGGVISDITVVDRLYNWRRGA